MEKVSKFTKALVKGVQSGDCLLLSKDPQKRRHP